METDNYRTFGLKRLFTPPPAKKVGDLGDFIPWWQVAHCLDFLAHCLDFLSTATYGHDPCTRKNQNQRSVGAKDTVKTDGRTRPIALLVFLSRLATTESPYSMSIRPLLQFLLRPRGLVVYWLGR